MRSPNDPKVFTPAYQWLWLSTGTVALIFGLTGLIIFAARGDYQDSLIWLLWLAGVAAMMRSTTRLKIVVEPHALVIKYVLGRRHFDLGDIEYARESNARDFSGLISFFRTLPVPMFIGRGVVLGVASSRRRLVPTWYRRLFINVTESKDFITALEEVGVTMVKDTGSTAEQAEVNDGW